jgi:hypothetical protein
VTVEVWVDQEGNRTTPPLSESGVADRAVTQGIATFTGLCMLAFGTYLAARTLLDRSRSRRWAAEWATVEPVWTRTVP